MGAACWAEEAGEILFGYFQVPITAPPRLSFFVAWGGRKGIFGKHSELWGKALVPLCVRQRGSTCTALLSASSYFRWIEGIHGLLKRIYTLAWECPGCFLIYPHLWSPSFSLLGAPLPRLPSPWIFLHTLLISCIGPALPVSFTPCHMTATPGGNTPRMIASMAY